MKLLLFIGSLLIFVAHPFLGDFPLSFKAILDGDSIGHKILFEMRLPRLFLAFFSGAILALGGLVFQSVFRNALTTPFTLGVASGATLGSAIAIVFLPLSIFSISWYFFTSLFGFFGAISTVLILFLLAARLKNYSTNSLLLVGIALSFFYSAALMALYYLSSLEESFAIVRYTMGSLDVVGFSSPILLLLISTGLYGYIWSKRVELKLLSTSYENAFLRGIDIKRLNFTLLFAVSIAVGATVSLVGPIGFVGLIIPHLLKNIYQKPIDSLILPVFFYGGVFLVLCDAIARAIPTLSGIPIGVVTSFIGGPFFLYILLRKR